VITRAEPESFVVFGTHSALQASKYWSLQRDELEPNIQTDCHENDDKKENGAVGETMVR
jgi:hypothetical protein